MPVTKRTKQQVDYGPGKPPHGDYCEICRHYIPIAGEAPECECVLGSIKWDAWCRLFRLAGTAKQQAAKAMRLRDG